MVCYMLWPLETLALFVYRTCVQPQNSKRKNWKMGTYMLYSNLTNEGQTLYSVILEPAFAISAFTLFDMLWEKPGEIKLPLNVNLKVFTCLMLYPKWNFEFSKLTCTRLIKLTLEFSTWIPSKWSFQGLTMSLL